MIAWIVGWSLSVPMSAQAQTVVLIRPPAGDPLQSDAFNRLLGELHIHGFETQLADPAPGAGDPVATLTALVKQRTALAALQLFRDEHEVWLAVVHIERDTGAALVHRLDFDSANADAANLIAVRAVDLLRAALLQVPGPEQHAEPAPVSQGATPATTSPREAPIVRAPDAPVATRWSLAIEADLLWAGERFGVGYGPALGVFHHPHARFQWGLWLAGPTFGMRLAASTGRAVIWQETALIEARAAFVRVHGFSLAATASGGAVFLQAKGSVRAPLVSKRDAVWSGAFALGLRAEQRLGANIAIGLSGRAVALVPELGVAILNEREQLQFPLLRAALGLVVAFE